MFRPEGIHDFTKIHVYARIDASVYATIYAESPDGNNLSNRRRANLVRKGMVQRSSETAVQTRPQGSIFPMRTIPKTDRTSGDNKPPMKTVLYCRVSTADQTLEHQRVQAEAVGYRFDEVIADHGISGVRTGLRDRPEGKRLFDMLRQGEPSSCAGWTA